MKRSIPIITLFLTMLFLFIPRVHAADTQQLAPKLVESCIYGQNLDISEYELTESELDELVNRLKEEGEMPWYFTGGYNYSYSKETGIVFEFSPTNMDPEQYDRTLYEQKLAAVMEQCVLEGMSDVQIALSVHDYLILHNVYDESLQANTAYDLLVNGTTVCVGYTELYMDILNRAGVPCVRVTSDAMEHTWNLVQIGGKWYHVDVTWDDPTPDNYGFVSHQYFLVTDQQLREGEEPHHGWETDIVCNDTAFVDAYWTEVESGIFFESSQVSYLIRSEDFTNYICRRDETTGKLTTLYTDARPYINIGYGKYTYTHRGLALRDGRLWFGTLDALRSVSTSGGSLQTEYRFREDGRYIFSFHIDGDTAYLSTGDHDGNIDTATAALPAAQAHEHSFTETVQPPQCEEGGYTTSVCQCGLSCDSDPVAPAGHRLEQTDKKKATLFSDGFEDSACTECDYTQTTLLPRLTFSQWLGSLFSWLLPSPAATG